MAAVDAHAVMALGGDVPGRLRVVTASASSRDSVLANMQSCSSGPVVIAVERYVVGKAAVQVFVNHLKVQLMTLLPAVHVRGSWFEMDAADMLAAFDEAALDCHVRLLTGERLIETAAATRRRQLDRAMGR